jgi:hypothetical protein
MRGNKRQRNPAPRACDWPFIRGKQSAVLAGHGVYGAYRSCAVRACAICVHLVERAQNLAANSWCADFLPALPSGGIFCYESRPLTGYSALRIRYWHLPPDSLHFALKVKVSRQSWDAHRAFGHGTVVFRAHHRTLAGLCRRRRFPDLSRYRHLARHCPGQPGGRAQGPGDSETTRGASSLKPAARPFSPVRMPRSPSGPSKPNFE